MITDIGFLAPGMDELVVRLGIGRKLSQFFFRCTHLSTVNCPAIAFSNSTLFISLSLWTLPLILLAPLASSPFLHSVAHYTRLVIPRPVHIFAFSPYSLNIVAFTWINLIETIFMITVSIRWARLEQKNQDSAAAALTWPGFVYNKFFTMC
jgi:hypothetical protein